MRVTLIFNYKIVTERYRWVDATNTTPDKALENAMKKWLKVAEDLWIQPKIAKTTDEVAIASTDIVTWCIVTDLWITYPYKK